MTLHCRGCGAFVQVANPALLAPGFVEEWDREHEACTPASPAERW